MKSNVMNFRCTDAQKEKINQKAEKANMKYSEYLLKSALNTRTRISSVGKDMTRTIAQIQEVSNGIIVEVERMECGYGTNSIQNMKRQLDELQERTDELWRLLK